MQDATVRLHFTDTKGRIQDSGCSLPLDAFAGFLATIGDQFLLPLAQGAPPTPESRKLLTVVGRVFNPRDLSDFAALICAARDVGEAEVELLPDDDPG